MTPRTLIVTILVALIAFSFIAFMWMQNTPSPDLSGLASSTPIATTTETAAAATSTVLIAMLDPEQSSGGIVRGCDKVVMINQQIPQTTAPLTAALTALFATNTTTVSGWFNFMPRTASTLHFDHATVSNGVASIYLTGSISGLAGECDDPRAQIQIEETAKQFPTVQSVQLYLNNKPVTSLAPSLK